MCGTEDALHEDNKKFIKYLDEKQISYCFEDGPGEHDYAYWDFAIKRVMDWLVKAQFKGNNIFEQQINSER